MPEQRADDREPEHAERELDATRDRDREHERERGEHEQAEPDGEPRAEQRREHREAQEPTAPAWLVRVVDDDRRDRDPRSAPSRRAGTAAARTARAGRGDLREIALRGDGVDAVREPGRERRPADADDRGCRAGTHRRRRAGSRAPRRACGRATTAPKSTVPRPPISASAGGAGDARPEAGVAPRRPEGVEQVADARPDTERADRRDTVRDQAARPERARARGTRGTRWRPGRARRRTRCRPRSRLAVAERAQPAVGVQVVGERTRRGGCRCRPGARAARGRARAASDCARLRDGAQAAEVEEVARTSGDRRPARGAGGR